MSNETQGLGRDGSSEDPTCPDPGCGKPLHRSTDPEDGVQFWICSGCSAGWNDEEVADVA